MLIVLLTFSGWLATKCIMLNNQACMARPTLINLNADKRNQRLRYYPFVVSLNRCDGSCNTFDDLSIRISVPNKTEDVNLNVFNMVAAINEWKTLTKHFLCSYIFKFDGKKCNSKFMASQPCWQTITIHIFYNISGTKDTQAMKSDQLIEYNKISIFP